MYAYLDLRRRADRYHELVRARIGRLCREAGLPGDASGAEHRRIARAWARGRPWPGVDAAKIAKAVWLRRHRLWAAHVLLARLVLQGRTDLTHSFLASTEVSHASQPIAR